MRSLAKPILLLVSFLLGFAILSTLALNLFLQWGNTRQLLGNELSGLVGAPVSIRSIFGLPLGSIRLSGIEAAEGGHSLLSAETVIIRPSYLALLSGKLEVTSIALKNPVIHWPLAKAETFATTEEKGLSDSSPAPVAPTTGNLPAPTMPSSTPVQETLSNNLPRASIPIIDSLKRVSITGGEFTLDDSNGAPLLSLCDLNLKGKQGASGTWSGHLQAAQVALGNSLFIRDLNSSISVTPTNANTSDFAITLDPVAATLGGGKLSGKLLVETIAPTPRYHLSLNLEGASLSQLLADASLGSSSADGKIEGDLDLAGIFGMRAGMLGHGSLSCSNATIQPADFLKQIGQILQVEELQLLRISEGKCLFQIDSNQIAIDELSLKSENLILTAQGPIRSSGDVDLNARLLFNQKMTSQLRGLLGSQLAPAPEAGYSQIPFHLSGSFRNPKTDLLERLTGIHIGGSLGGFLQGLFGSPAAH